MNKKNRHKWDVLSDTCLKCGLKRRWTRKRYSPLVYGKPGHEYLKEGEWSFGMPECISKNEK